MAIFRQYIAPLIVVLIFALSLVVVSARIFLPSDMAAPAPVEEADSKAEVSEQATIADEVAGLPSTLEILVKGIPTLPGLSTPL
jgi:hypothetical protein